MAKYKLTEAGVTDTETDAAIPNDDGNRHWRQYQEWLAAGNTPDPIETPEEEQLRILKEEIFALQTQLNKVDRVLLRLVRRLATIMVQKGVCTKAEIGDTYVDLANTLEGYLDQLEAKEGELNA